MVDIKFRKLSKSAVIFFRALLYEIKIIHNTVFVHVVILNIKFTVPKIQNSSSNANFILS